MAALFSRSATRWARVGLAALVLGPIALSVLLMAWVRTPLVTGRHSAPEQPIPFSHPVHVTGLRIDCRYCHSTVERSPSAGLPATSACVPCHSRVWREGPWFEPVRRSLATGRPIPWRRVNALPDFVYFDHAIHLKAGVACGTCHGAVERMERVEQAAPLTMGWCVDCHRRPERYVGAADPGVTVRRITTCTACHR